MKWYKRVLILGLAICMLFQTGCSKSKDDNESEYTEIKYVELGPVESGSSESSSADSGSSTTGSNKTNSSNSGSTTTDNTKADVKQFSDQQFTVMQTAGTDSLGRVKKPYSSAKESKYVGIFYFLWLGDDEMSNIYDISDILEAYAGLETDTVNNPLWASASSAGYDAKVSPEEKYHYFEEPLYGYYKSCDKWVIKRHLELLTYAGIDFLYLDFTNASGSACLYPEATYALLDSILELQAEGLNVPRIVPIVCNPYTSSDLVRSKTVEIVYNNYYAKDNFKYKSCWFYADKKRNPEQKPMLITHDLDESYRPDIKNSFWTRKVAWPIMLTDSSEFPWMDFQLPQQNYNGIMNVSVAQHNPSHSSEAYLGLKRTDKSILYRGRGAYYPLKTAYETGERQAVLSGTNFQEQWDYVFSYPEEDFGEVWMVTVTGWNEWIARKIMGINGRDYATFVDTFSIEYSRDIEMMRDKNGYADNYYMQLCTNVAKFKYGNEGYITQSKKTIDYKKISSWDKVVYKYIDFSGDATNRSAKSVGNVYTYTDNTARNNFEYLKLANDDKYLYVLAHTKNNITKRDSKDTGWMNLYISTGKSGGWENYNFIINRSGSDTTASIESLSTKNNAISTQKLGATADIFVSGKDICYRIPLSALGKVSEIQIKACDNVFAGVANTQNDGVGVYRFGDIMGFYCGGDCAPIGRLNYAYKLS